MKGPKPSGWEDILMHYSKRSMDESLTPDEKSHAFKQALFLSKMGVLHSQSPDFPEYPFLGDTRPVKYDEPKKREPKKREPKAFKRAPVVEPQTPTYRDQLMAMKAKYEPETQSAPAKEQSAQVKKPAVPKDFNLTPETPAYTPTIRDKKLAEQSTQPSSAEPPHMQYNPDYEKTHGLTRENFETFSPDFKKKVAEHHAEITSKQKKIKLPPPPISKVKKSLMNIITLIKTIKNTHLH